MTERFGTCKACVGTGEIFKDNTWVECGICMGNAGFSGDASEWDKMNRVQEEEKFCDFTIFSDGYE